MPRTTESQTPLRARLVGGFSYGDGGPDPGSSPIHKSATPSSAVVFDFLDVLTYIQKTSSSTPNWDKSKTRFVEVPLRSNIPKIPPLVRPVYKPLAMPLHPIRSSDSSDRQWRIVMRKYNAKLRAWDILNGKRLNKFETTVLQKYLRRSQEVAVLNGKISILNLRKKLVPRGKIVYSTNNPYQKIVYRDTGWTIRQYKYEKTYKMVPIDGTTPTRYSYRVGEGPNVAEMQYFEGNSGSTLPAFWQHPGPDFPRVPRLNNIINEATLKAKKHLFDALSGQEVHVGNIVAERAQSYNTLVTAFEALRAYVRSPKSAVKKFLTGSPSKSVANAQLAYCFGVEPLVRDIHSIVKKISSTFADDKAKDMIRMVGSGKSVFRDSLTENRYGFYTDTWNIEITTTVRYMCEYRVTNSSVAYLKNFGLLNPAEVLWEVTPWSFLVDWVLPIGNAFQALSADAGLEFYSGTESVRTKVTRTLTRVYCFEPALHKATGKKFSGKMSRTIEQEWKDRRVLSGPPKPSLPRFKNPFSARHFTLALSLWRQRSS